MSESLIVFPDSNIGLQRDTDNTVAVAWYFNVGFSDASIAQANAEETEDLQVFVSRKDEPSEPLDAVFNELGL